MNVKDYSDYLMLLYLTFHPQKENFAHSRHKKYDLRHPTVNVRTLSFSETPSDSRDNVRIKRKNIETMLCSGPETYVRRQHSNIF